MELTILLSSQSMISMRIKTEIIKRPIFFLEEVINDPKVGYISFIKETDEIFVQLRKDEKHLEWQGYFFKNCDNDLFNKMKKSTNMYDFIKQTLYTTKDYTLELIYG